MTPEQQISDRLLAIEATMNERGGEGKAWVNAGIQAGSGEVLISLYVKGVGHPTCEGHHCIAPTFAEALAQAEDWAAAMPTAEEAAIAQARRSVATALEDCEAAGIDAPAVAPLRGVMDDLSARLLTYRPDGEAA